MAAPCYSTEPTTDFLRRLKEEGFEGWLSLEFAGDKSAFWKFLAFGIKLHSQVQYPSGEGHFLNNKWRPKVRPILAADQYFASDPNHTADPRYWSELGSACQSLAISILQISGKDHITSEIEKGGLPDKSVISAYEVLSSNLNLCICWYEIRADQSIITTIFAPKAKGEVALFITLAEEGSRLYFLYHSKVREDVKIDFPYAMKVGVEGKPLVIGNEGAQGRKERDPRDVLIGHLVKTVQASVSLVLASGDYLPGSASELLQSFQDRLRATTSFISSSQLDSPLLSDPISQFLTLRIPDRPANAALPPHTVLNCEEYANEGELTEFHSHKFHRSCLARYLEGLQPSFPRMPKCPMEGCEIELPDSALDLNASVRDVYVRMRQASTESALLARQPSPSLPPVFLVQCQKCFCRYHSPYFMTHGCSICIECAYMDYSYNNGCCSACGMQFNYEELQKLTMYYERTIRGTRVIR